MRIAPSRDDSAYADALGWDGDLAPADTSDVAIRPGPLLFATESGLEGEVDGSGDCGCVGDTVAED